MLASITLHNSFI